MTGETSEKAFELTWGIDIPMRDGVTLNGTLYRPKEQEDPLPVIFTITPYISDTYHERGAFFSRNGYIFVLVDVRGRGNSGGDFEPMGKNEGPDGYDIAEWLAAQSWCNGKIAMWGGSYAGLNQWSTLKEMPPHLSTIVPAAAAHHGVDFPGRNNIWYSYIAQWITFTSGVTPNTNLFGESAYWINRFSKMYLNHIPFNKLDSVIGNPSKQFQRWIRRTTAADWDEFILAKDEYSKINIPILTITGHYDGDQAGAMAYYRRHMQFGTTDAKSRHYLIMGPWDHAGTRTPNKQFGGLTFDDASVIDLNQIHKEWYDWTLKDGEKPGFLKDRVACYVAGREEWRYATSLEELATMTRKLYLDSFNGRANETCHSGMLGETQLGDGEPDRYIYDPLDTQPAELEQEAIKDYLTDQRYALNLYGNGLVYHTEPFKDKTELTGYCRFVAWIEMDVPDTDFLVSLYEIQLDGTSVLLTEDAKRARYRESTRYEVTNTPGKIYRYEFYNFDFISREIAKGSRIRLVFRSPNSIYWQKNYNSGGVVMEESSEDAQTAHIVLYHDEEYESFLEIPVAQVRTDSSD